jgi:repressor of nif and glnA expression
MSEAMQKLRIAILRSLRDAGQALSSARIAEQIAVQGFEISPRSVRLHLEEMESEGLVAHARRGRRGGRTITDKGLEEIQGALIQDRLGFTAVRVDTLAWRMNFDPLLRYGQIVLNLTTVAEEHFGDAVEQMIPVFESGWSMGDYVALFREGENLGDIRIPRGRVGIGTVCSVTINGVLMSGKVPTTSRFGGVLEIAESRPVRFTDVIYYDGTSLDPLEIFIKGGLTSVGRTARTGRGRIGVSFREVPSCALDEVERILRRLDEIGLGGVVRMGSPNQPLLGFSVPEGRTGFVVNGGLNPMAAVEEAGVRTENRALAQLYDFERLVHYRELQDHV